MSSLEQSFKRSIDDEKFILKQIENPEEKPFYILSLIQINTIFFLYRFFVQKDVQLSKSFLYKIAGTFAYYHEKLNGEVFEALKTFTYPLLCDNNTVVNRYQDYHKTKYSDSFSTYFAKAIQSTLKNDNSALEVNIAGLKKWSRKGWPKQYIGIITVFEGFLINDKSAIENGLQEITDLHDKQDQPPIVKDYINLEATALAKLAWRKGIEVEVASDLVPKELLPVLELQSYEGYPFFEELSNY
ncbi:MAG TPA: Imm49 family immunity protein [Ohtaekwangia sp.]|uniref:Imm49 family immunity protein n=1 Tax=Ohtaekwangia sp. TaxID=2066019 RepID=UPI002F94BDC3